MRVPASALFALAMAGGTLVAQERAGTTDVSAAAVARPVCEGRVVTRVTVTANPPYPEGIVRRWSALARALQSLHTTTQSKVVRRLVVVEEGETCSELRLAETERLLRAQPFIADAVVTTAEDGPEGVAVHVETLDEVSLVVGVTGSGSSPFLEGMRLGDGNVSGAGVYVAGEWGRHPFYRDTYGARLIDYQFLGEPYQLALVASRRHLGSLWAVEASHPFLTDLQRITWRTSAGGDHRYFTYRLTGEPMGISLALDRRYADIGGMVRIGVPGRLSLFGASFSREEVAPGRAPVIISDTGVFAPAAEDEAARRLADRYHFHRSARVNALWGVRNISFMRVRGFDALTGVQDVRKGFQLSALFGRSLGVLGSHDDDIFLSGNLYAANGTPHVFIAMQTLAEGRHNYNENAWDGVLASGRIAAHVRAAPRHMVEVSGEWSAGWRLRVPFQLTLADVEGGVRGYRASRVGGGQRAVLRVEDRWYLGTPWDVADAGVALFADYGRIRRGDVPFGVNSRNVLGVGAGLLVAVPPRSKRLWRVDVAVPVTREPDARWEIRLSSRDHTRLFWREPADIARSRDLSMPSSVFNWP